MSNKEVINKNQLNIGGVSITDITEILKSDSVYKLLRTNKFKKYE